MAFEMKKVQPTLEKLFLVFSREATIVNQRTNGPINAHLTSVSCFSIIYQILGLKHLAYT